MAIFWATSAFALFHVSPFMRGWDKEVLPAPVNLEIPKAAAAPRDPNAALTPAEKIAAWRQARAAAAPTPAAHGHH